MKKILCGLLGCLAITVYGGDPGVEVKLSLTKSELFAGETVDATVSVTNVGQTDLMLPRPDRAGFKNLLELDNPRMGFAGGVEIISVKGESFLVPVKPGETEKTQIQLFRRGKDLSPKTIRMGFRISPEADPVWSNPVTVALRKDEAFPIKVDVDLQEKTIDISNIKEPRFLTAHIRISNPSWFSQAIGTDRLCGVEELNSLVSDSEDIQVHSAEVACTRNAIPSREVVLTHGQIYEQNCQLSYAGGEAGPKNVTFRVGVKNVGHIPAWSAPLNVRVVGGGPEWVKHMQYLKNEAREGRKGHPDGVYKGYWENGSLREETMYQGGKRNGRSKYYDEHGKKLSDEFYSHGELVNSFTYHKDGSIHSHTIHMILENGHYIPQEICAEGDSDKEVLKILPRCK